MQALSPEEVARRRRRGLALHKEGNTSNLLPTIFAVLSTFNVDLISPLLRESLERVGLYSDVYLAQFGQIAQEILDPNSGLYAAEPECVILIPSIEDLMEPLFSDPSRFTQEEAGSLANDRAQELRELVLALLKRLPGATCYVIVLGSLRAPVEHVLDPQSPQRGQAALEHLNSELRGFGALSPRVVVVDWDWHIHTAGMRHCRDERLWYLGRMRLNPVGLASIAELTAQYVAAYRGSARKVAVVDLDDTLWGGVVGEDDLTGLVLGEEGLGLAFQDFQRELLNLHNIGVVLAVCSKNNAEEVWATFDCHSGMVLEREHFAAVRVNWQDKATNLVELSDELGLALNSFVFLDDSPVERAWVRDALPEVLVPDLPIDPAYRPEFLRNAPFFRRINVTEADLRRGESYQVQGLRNQLRGQTTTLDEFLASLQQQVIIEPLHEGALARAAQMCQRTNQFNLTTRRHTVAELAEMKNDPAVEVYTLAVTDRFGDNGITGIAILRYEGETAEIDTLLLSCRVLGRRVEDSFLEFLAERAHSHGSRYLIGRYLATTKNEQVALLYPNQGFEPIGDGLFRIELEQQRLDPGTPGTVGIAASP